MKNLWLFSIVGLLFLQACNSSKMGQRVKMPFSGSKYQSNNLWFRGVGVGESSNLDIARSKATLEAKRIIASGVRTRMQGITDEYQQEVGVGNAADLKDRFEQLTRELVNQDISDLRVKDSKIYLKDGKYTVYVAMESRRRLLFKNLERLAKNDARFSNNKPMIQIIEKEVSRLEALE